MLRYENMYDYIQQTMLKTFLFSLKFIKNTQGNIISKINKTIHYTSLFHYHYTLQQNIQIRNLQIFTQNKKRKKQKNIQYYKIIMGKYFQLRKKLLKQGQQKINELKDQNIRQSLVKNIMKEGFQKMTLFYQSLQNLVEGRREVLQNQEFIFEDGMTVNQKRQKFEKYIEKFFGKKTVNPNTAKEQQQ